MKSNMTKNNKFLAVLITLILTVGLMSSCLFEPETTTIDNTSTIYTYVTNHNTMLPITTNVISLSVLVQKTIYTNIVMANKISSTQVRFYDSDIQIDRTIQGYCKDLFNVNSAWYDMPSYMMGTWGTFSYAENGQYTLLCLDPSKPTMFVDNNLHIKLMISWSQTIYITNMSY